MIVARETPVFTNSRLTDKALNFLSRHTFCLLENPECQESSITFLSDVFEFQPLRVKLKLIALVTFLWFAFLLRYGKILCFTSIKEKNTAIDSLISIRYSLFRIAGHAWRAYSLLAMFRSPAARSHYFKEPPKPVIRATPRSLVKDKALPPITDYIIIGSGPAGSIAAARLAAKGADVLVLEEGNYFNRDDYEINAFHSMNRMLRDFALQTTTTGVPVLQGRAVGGTSLINGAIIERLPRHIFDDWGLPISYAALETEMAQIETELEVDSPTAHNLPQLPVHRLLNEMGWAHHAMKRSARNCQGSGRCFQGCPTGAKRSMENSYLALAVEHGTFIAPGHRAEKILLRDHHADAVVVRTSNGVKRIESRKGILIAAGAVHSPALLWRSGISHPALGKGFQCHWSASVAALLPVPVADWEGPPQGIEVSHFDNVGIRLATQLLPPELKLARSFVTGNQLEKLLQSTESMSSWMLNVRSESEGTLTFRLGLPPRIFLPPTTGDLEKIRLGMSHLVELFEKCGALEIYPGVMGKNHDWKQLPPFLGAGHLFGGCRMGTDANSSVVDTDFSVRETTGLFCIDASVFPSHIGVHPQLSIMALASHASKQLA